MLPEDAVSNLSSVASPMELGRRCKALRTAVLLGACHPRVGGNSPLRLLPLTLLNTVLDSALPLEPCLELKWLLQEWMPGDSSSSSSSDSEGDSNEEGSSESDSDTGSDDNEGRDGGGGPSGSLNEHVVLDDHSQGRGRGARGGPSGQRGLGARGGRRGRGRGSLSAPNDLQMMLKWI